MPLPTPDIPHMPDLDLMSAYADKAQRAAENVLFNSMQIANRIRELYTGPDHVSDYGAFVQASANDIVAANAAAANRAILVMASSSTRV